MSILDDLRAETTPVCRLCEHYPEAVGDLAEAWEAISAGEFANHHVGFNTLARVARKTYPSITPHMLKAHLNHAFDAGIK